MLVRLFCHFLVMRFQACLGKKSKFLITSHYYAQENNWLFNQKFIAWWKAT
jgi:hypothetical protein